jgi:hypothetical protein
MDKMRNLKLMAESGVPSEYNFQVAALCAELLGESIDKSFFDKCSKIMDCGDLQSDISNDVYDAPVVREYRPSSL